MGLGAKRNEGIGPSHIGASLWPVCATWSSVAGMMTSPSLIETEADLAAACTALSAGCTDMARLVAAHGLPPLRRRPPGFDGLVQIIVFQQISTAAARGIMAKLDRVLGPLTPQRVMDLGEDDLREGGLSRPKVRTLKAVAHAVLAGTLDLDRLPGLAADRAHAHLTAVSGIGPWTADVYLLFCLGHTDAWPAGDLALQVAAADLLGLPARPDARAMIAIGERWRPHRASAARLLWAAYAAARQGRNADPVTA